MNKPARRVRVLVALGFAATTLVVTAGSATASPAHSPVPQATFQHLHHSDGRHGHGDHDPAQEAAEAFCRGLAEAARQGHVPESVLALCKQVNGWD
ncbi:hypothetical protein ACIQMR_19710 [Streptomyces sp. NPDC091376]|uniref:hypothetical protein n=1 Tax=Streptomyces sp. NPDC091376 TaxID=3365994 RepID=UPI00380F31E2